ncbi:MAG: DUF4349 domain-containing protein [Chloroflexi bacterium]|nr:DUF4349 domain-containing protein [Chloroflexota bacterium]
MRSVRALVLALALVVALIMTGCAGAPSPAAKDAGGGREMASGMAPAAPAAAPQEAPAQPSLAESSYGGRTPADLPSYEEVGAERMIIRTANLSVVVKDTGETMESLTGLVAAYKGYVADSNRWYSNDQLYAAATLRVPAESLDAFLAEVRDLAIKVESENISGNDVTEEYADINAQLVNLEATEVELRELLTEVRENRGKAEEIMSVYRELSSVRGQIESLKGRQKYLGQMVAMSTVNLQVRPELAPRAVVRESWNPVVTMSNAANTLVEVVKTFVSVIIYVVVLSPVVLVPLAILWLLAWYLRRRRKARKASEPEAQA